MDKLNNVSYIEEVKNRGKYKSKFNPNGDIEGIIIYKLTEEEELEIKNLTLKCLEKTVLNLTSFDKTGNKRKRPNFRTEITREIKNLIRDEQSNILKLGDYEVLKEEGNLEDKEKILYVYEISYKENRGIYIEIRDMWINIEFTKEMTSDLFNLNGILLKNIKIGEENLINILDALLGLDELKYEWSPEFELNRQNLVDIKNDRFIYLNPKYTQE